MRSASLILSMVLVPFTIAVPTRAEVRPDPDRFAGAQRALVAWYDCIECVNFELESLLLYRDLIEGALISTLNKGLSPVRRAEIQAGLRKGYRPTPARDVSVDEYVAFFTSNADASYRKRAAIALGRLRTPSAAVALRTAAQNPDLRADVRAAALEALEPP